MFLFFLSSGYSYNIIKRGRQTPAFVTSKNTSAQCVCVCVCNVVSRLESTHYDCFKVGHVSLRITTPWGNTTYRIQVNEKQNIKIASGIQRAMKNKINPKI